MSPNPSPQPRRWYSRLLPASLEGRVAGMTAVLLLVTVILVWLVRWWGRDNVAWNHVMTVGRFLGELLLAIVIPTILYWAMRWWSRVEREVYPDIDRAWQAGIEALHVNGISLEELPLFLVLGSPDAEFEHQLMDASLTQPRILGVPQETTVTHALRWYASSQAIYLFCTNTCALSALAQAWKPYITQPHLAEDDMLSSWSPPPSGPAVRRPRTPPPQESDSVRTSGHYETMQPLDAARPVASRHHETVLPENLYEPRPSAMPSEHLAQPARGQAEWRSEQTIAPGEVKPPRSILAAVVESRREELASRKEAADTLASFPGIDPGAHVERLQYVCQLLRHARSPRCGINGVLALLPLQLADATPHGRDLQNIAKAARTDITKVQQTLGLRIPITSMVVGLQREKGFAEFISRLDRLDPGFRFRRLGGRFELTSYPTEVRLNKHSDRICDAFEEWIFELFRQPEAHKNHRGSRQLYWLLSRIRGRLKFNLRIVLGEAFGIDLKLAGTPEEQALLFSGCYFAAVGPAPQDSAFVRGVVEDKMLGEQPQVEWNAQSQFRQRLFRLVVVAAWALFGVLLAMLLYRLLNNPGS